MLNQQTTRAYVCVCTTFTLSLSFCCFLLDDSLSFHTISIYAHQAIHVVMRTIYVARHLWGSVAINVCDSRCTQKNGHFIHYVRYINLNFILCFLKRLSSLKLSYFSSYLSLCMHISILYVDRSRGFSIYHCYWYHMISYANNAPGNKYSHWQCFAFIWTKYLSDILNLILF